MLCRQAPSRAAPRRTRRTPEEQAAEYAVLNYLLNGEAAKRAALIRATGATRALMDGMVRKKWIARETLAAPRDARRMERYAVLVEGERLPKLNENQQTILADAGWGGRHAAGCRVARHCRAGINPGHAGAPRAGPHRGAPAAFHLSASAARSPSR